jgi:hypothetical protein
MTKTIRSAAAAAVLGLGCWTMPCAAQEGGGIMDELSQGFYSRINVLGFGQYQDIRASPLNPGNTLGLARNQAELQVRPDFNLKLRRFEFDLKPRFYRGRATVPVAGSEARHDERDQLFVNEGTVRFRPHDRLTLSAGRENLQWGPSALLSPSNPFNANNGRNNPYVELPGLDYARAVWVTSPALTVSLIANTGRGRLDPANRYRKARAAKVDYTGDAAFASVIVSKADGGGDRIGGFAGWNASDAWSLHVEGSAGRRQDGAPPESRNRQLLVGTSYTLEAGPTLSVEYFFNKDGCRDAPIQACLARRGALLDPVQPLARRRYALLQYLDTRIGGKLNLSARLIRNIDDRSMQFVLNAEYELGQHWALYLVPTFYRGERDSEFGSLLGRSVFAGASYTF